MFILSDFMTRRAVRATYDLSHVGRSPASSRQPLFEAHVTASRDVDSKSLITQIQRLGISFGIDFFRKVTNVDRDGRLIDLARSASGGGSAELSCSTPTGHDLEQPGLMITFRAREYTEIVEQVRQVLEIVVGTDKPHNFEIEKMLRDKRTTPVSVDMQGFSGYKAVDQSKRPLYESHIGWHLNASQNLPSHERIVQDLVRVTGFMPHQIVDFSENRAEGPITDTVVSFYQATAADTLRFHPTLKRAARVLGAAYVLKEQVCVVGEPLSL